MKTKNLLSMLLVLSLLFGLLNVFVIGTFAASEEVGDYLAIDYDTPNDIKWTLTTLDGREINQDIYKGKVIVFIFYRGNDACGNSNGINNIETDIFAEVTYLTQ